MERAAERAVESAVERLVSHSIAGPTLLVLPGPVEPVRDSDRAICCCSGRDNDTSSAALSSWSSCRSAFCSESDCETPARMAATRWLASTAAARHLQGRH